MFTEQAASTTLPTAPERPNDDRGADALGTDVGEECPSDVLTAEFRRAQVRIQLARDREQEEALARQRELARHD